MEEKEKQKLQVQRKRRKLAPKEGESYVKVWNLNKHILSKDQRGEHLLNIFFIWISFLRNIVSIL